MAETSLIQKPWRSSGSDIIRLDAQPLVLRD